jgi:multidrug efflux system membrane fusion protein
VSGAYRSRLDRERNRDRTPSMTQTAHFLVGVSLLAACHKSAPPAFERPPSPVTVAAAQKQDVPRYLDEVGKCVARESVTIEPQVSGPITAIHFADGADVKTGDTLFTIDVRPYQAQLDAAQARLAQSQATAELARQQLARLDSLTDPAAMSQQDRDVRKNALDVAAAQVKAAEAAIATAKLDVGYCTIVSPIDGRAGHRLVDIGNVVETNPGTPLVVLQRLDPVYAEFTISEDDLGAVQQNMATKKLQVEIRLPEEPDAPRAGELTFLDNAVNAGTGTVSLRATIENKDHRFWPGRFVKVRLVLSTLEGAILVPASAPQLSARGPFVYVIKEDSTAELRPVTPGQRQGDLVVVEKGLEPGERVVIAGQMGVMPGAKVRVVEPAGTPQ